MMEMFTSVVVMVSRVWCICVEVIKQYVLIYAVSCRPIIPPSSCLLKETIGGSNYWERSAHNFIIST